MSAEMRLRCGVCNGWFSTPNLVPFCSEKCRKARARQIERAVRDLSRDDFSGDPDEQLADAEVIYSLWFARAADDLVHKHWSNLRPSTPAAPADPQVRAALVERINRLRGVVRSRQEERARVERAESARRVSVQETADRDAADKSWRENVLAAVRD
jgi:hypothetical protein